MDYSLQLFAAHLADLRRSPRTVDRYLRVLRELRKFLDATFGTGKWTFDQVRQDHLVCFLRGEQPDKRAATTTTNVRLAAIRTFFSYLQRQKMVSENPADGISFLSDKPKEPTFLTAGEYRALLEQVRTATAPQLKIRNEAIVVILFNTGLRVSELASLTLDNLDASSKAFRNVLLKGGQFGSIEWNRETDRVLSYWLETRSKWAAVDGDRHLFVTEKGSALSVRAIEDLFAHYSEAACFGKQITPHVLRHSMATELLRQGYDIRVIAGILHHRSLNTTKRYAHLVDSLRRQALASLEPKKPRRIRQGN